MALIQFAADVATSGDAWVDLVYADVGKTVTGIVLTAGVGGDAHVSVRVARQNGTQKMILNKSLLKDSASARVRLPSLFLDVGDRLQVKSLGAVDWVASGVAK